MRLALLLVMMMGAGMAESAASAATCSPADIAATATALQDSRFALSQLPPHAGTSTAISPRTSSAITQTKARLVDFVTAYMGCQRSTADAQGIQVDLSRLGWAKAPDPNSSSGSATDGFRADPSLAFDVRPFAGGLLGVTARFGIPCGGDTLLMLFQIRGDDWDEILRVQSGPYRDLADAYQDFDYAISPADDSGGWFLVEKHLPTICISVSAAITYSVLRMGPAPSRPRHLFSGHDPIYWGGEDYGRLTVDADGFEIRFHDDGGDRAEPVEVVRAFTVSGNSVKPAQRSLAE